METINQERATVTRAMLIDYVATHPARRRPRTWGIALVLVGALAGAGVSSVAFAASSLFSPRPQQPAGQPTPELPPSITAPAGITPGSPVIAVLGDPITIAFDGATTVALTDRPADATHVRVTVAPTVATDANAAAGGSISFGTEDGGNSPSLNWTASDIAAGVDLSTWYDFPLDGTVSALYLTSEGAPAVASLQYLTHVPTDIEVNANGDSYGIAGSTQGEPDLIRVMATNGEEGYVYRTELEEADGTAAARGFTSPDDALAWQKENAGVVHLIPVYRSDGTTLIGEFQVGG